MTPHPRSPRVGLGVLLLFAWAGPEPSTLEPPLADMLPGTSVRAPDASRMHADSFEIRRGAEDAVARYVNAVRRAGAPGDLFGSHAVRIPARAGVASSLRPRAIAELDAAAEHLPGDDWIAGHRVGLRIKHGLPRDALRVASECRGSTWWCEALRGFALHVMGDPASAHEAFATALHEMPREVRCNWEELELLLEGVLAQDYLRGDCDERLALAQRVWWLAQPFHLRPYNERRSEHMVRLVAMQLHHDILPLSLGMRPWCVPEHHHPVLRRGWPDWWWGYEGPQVASDDPGYSFIPAPEVGLSPLDSTPWDWDLRPSRAIERYNPGYGPIHDLEQQTAFLRRGQTVLVVVAADLSGQALAGARPLEAGVVLSRSETDTPRVIRPEGPPDRLLFRATVPEDAYLVSVEAISDGIGAARTRFGHRLPDPTDSGVSLSDLVLFEWDAEFAPELESILPAILGTHRVERSQDVGVFWETYGVKEGQGLQVSITAVADPPGRLRRLGQILRILPQGEVMEFTWEEIAEGDAAMGRILRVDLAGLGTAGYQLVLRVQVDGGSATTATRRLEIVD